MAPFFPRWTNYLPLKIAIALFLLGSGVVAGIWYYFTPKYTRVGYMPSQPVHYSHKIHVGELGMDCRYCHSFVEKSSHSNVPTSETCMNCHKQVKATSPRLAPIRESYESGKSMEWIKVHKTPDFVYFNHSVHINRGVSCQHCHGNINEMPVVYQAEPQSMGWCLNCHRNPEKNLRPLDQVLNFQYDPAELDREDFYRDLMGEEGDAGKLIAALEKSNRLQESGGADMDALLALAGKTYGTEMTQSEVGRQLKAAWNVNPPKHCTACHR